MACKRFEGKVALITGGGTGIGAAAARRIAAEGGKVVVTGRRPGPIAAIAEETGGLALAGDATDQAHVEAAVALAVDRFGGLDVLVANAGIGFVSPLVGLDLAAWKQTMSINLDGPMLASKAAIPAMIKRGGGAIVHVASLAAVRALPFSSAYMASKAAVLALNRSIAFDYGPQGIRSNAICPALVPTEMAEEGVTMAAAAQGLTYKELEKRIANVYPLRRVGIPDDIAAAIAFFASDDAAFITGTMLMADGGASIVDCAVLA
jgi:meso-butanediol dehydrogenase / (S,S)-butanediol dehydrogenase / diacetyl reductase